MSGGNTNDAGTGQEETVDGDGVALLFAGASTTPEPPLPPGYLAEVLRRARRARRRRRAAAAVAAVLAVVAVGAVAPPLVRGWNGPAHRDLPDAAAARAAVQLPDRVAGYSPLTADVRDDPAGPAIAAYALGSDEVFDTWQVIVVGAGRDTYRRVGAVDARSGRGLPDFLLAPDGTGLVVGDSREVARDLLMVDLRTGRERRYPVDPPGAVRLLAWSPDGRYVAYGVGPAGGTGARVGGTGASPGARLSTALAVLDLRAGTTARITDLGPLSTAAFAPDSTRIAVQTGDLAPIVDRSGQRRGYARVAPPDEVIPGAAWSPDGELVGGSRPAAGLPTAAYPSLDDAVTFLPWRDGDALVGWQLQAGAVLGWTGARSVVTVERTDGGTGAVLTERDLRDGARRVLTRFAGGRDCELWTHRCRVAQVSLAGGLLSGVPVRAAGDPDRGPWPPRVRGALLFLALLGAGALMVWRRRRVELSQKAGPAPHA